MRSVDIMKDVFDNSEMDVPARDIPKDISTKESKEVLRRNHNNQSNRDDIYSPDHFVDSIYSPTQFQDDPFIEDGFMSTAEDGILADIPGESSSRHSSPGEKKNPAELLLHMYTRFAACVSAVAISPQHGPSSFLMDDDSNIWDIPNDETNDETNDYEDEHQEQIQRLTSWNTLETSGTFITHGSEIGASSSSQKKEKPPSALSNTWSKNKSVKKKRTVQFDYPIISSLKECPRPDPRDLPNLYFTEEELGQIEDDRESTYTADDVEVVCVSNSTEGDNHNSENDPTMGATPRVKNGKSIKNASLAGKHSRSKAQSSSTNNLKGKQQPTPSDSPDRKRHIKSVQIYLRERSRVRSPRS